MSLRVDAVEGRSGTRRFIDVPWRLQNEQWEKWVPPLRLVVADALDDRRNPFYREAARQLFVAERDGRVVGRVAAIENRAHNRHHDDRTGFFGFFEVEDEPETAAALLAAAEAWLTERGLASARGPISPSMNHESGLLDGFDTPPMVMTPWNPSYYGALVEGSGYEKAKDLLGYYIPGRTETMAVPDRVRRLAERTLKRTGVTFRELDVAILKREARKVLDLYCDAWADNWGFVPPSWDEFWHTAKDLKTVLVPDFSFVAEVDGEIVGFMLIARDINRLLAENPSGRLWPGTVFKLLTRLGKVEQGRIVLLGMRAEYRNRGLFPLFAFEAARRGHEMGFDGAEASWILEDNEQLTAPLAAMNIEPYKTWRVYEKALI